VLFAGNGQPLPSGTELNFLPSQLKGMRSARR
jgi:hypothetical protein